MEKEIKNNYGFATRSIHAGETPDFREGATGDVVTPIHLSTTFAREKVDVMTAGYEYTRCLNPTRKALEEKLAALENAEYGLVFSSGLAAETTVLLALLKSGDHIISVEDLYGGTKRLFDNILNGYNISASYVDGTTHSCIEEAIQSSTRMIWIESPSNPLLKICDIRAIADISKKHGLILVVDNTFLSPYFQTPIDLGADIVLHSSTKYIGGHSDVLGGALLTSNVDYFTQLKYYQDAVGAVLSPFDSYLTMRGIKTLAIRMQQHEKNALAIARYLESHPKVKQVLYPGLKSHPQHELAKTQGKGFGGVISFDFNGTVEQAKEFQESLRVFALAESLGGVESLIEQPAFMTHISVDRETRQKVGITDTMIRVSVGIEDIQDLINDLEQGFNKVK